MAVLRLSLVILAFLAGPLIARSAPLPEISSPPAVGSGSLRILGPDILEVEYITSKAPNAAPARWNWIDASGTLRLPPAQEFTVLVNGEPAGISTMGFKRRVSYAPLHKRDLRIGNHLFLKLTSALPKGAKVEVKNPAAAHWEAGLQFAGTFDDTRLSEVIHVNQTGYAVDQPKKAMLGYYLGSLGELPVKHLGRFLLLSPDGKEVFRGELKPRPDQGFPFSSYQQVLEADFSSFTNSGEYRLAVEGLGRSYPFFISPGYPAMLARTYALGLYHQRCGTANELPYSRFVHGPCHLHPAEIPTAAFTNTQKFIAQDAANAVKNSRHTAPVMTGFGSSLYPLVKQGTRDVSQGHHDAGDYSKYTINSAGLIHHLVFAADVFPGAGDLDNLGLPESGDGVSDLLQEADWEAQFLAKMQDDDGGFYFLVYPRERRYEHNVLPDAGDRQIVWPKTTAATAAAVAALAQISSSPRFQKHHPHQAKLYLQKAVQGWEFLERAIARFGKDGAYQKITHYGDDFMHDDELAWAACELFLATGEQRYHKKLMDWFRPEDPATRKWGWWRLYDAYGNAARSYAFAEKSGRTKSSRLNHLMLVQCENEVANGAEDQLQRSRQSAYGTSFPVETKRVRSAGWYFSSGPAFDLAVGCQLNYPVNKDLRPAFREAILANFNYELGCNPVNVSYLTGTGFRRPHELVHHVAQNDRRILPPSGIPIGNLQAGFGWLDHYKQELGALTFPPDGTMHEPFPIYDRWGDSFNVQTEFVVVNQARALAAACFLMGQSPLKGQMWQPQALVIKATNDGGAVSAQVSSPFSDLRDARFVWETSLGTVSSAPRLEWSRQANQPQWLEVEATLPDGRRMVGVTNFPPAVVSK